MGTFSIWHWLIVLLVLLLIFGLPALAVAKENSELRIGRREFLLWVIAYIGIPFVIGFIGALLDETDISQVIGFIFGLAIIYPLYQRYVRRARDAGMVKTIAYLSIIPLVNIITTLILLFKVGETGLIEVVKPKKQPVTNGIEKNNTVEKHRIETPDSQGGDAQKDEIQVNEKECPRCAEIIKRRAKYCRYCSYEYSEEEFAAEQKLFAKEEAIKRTDFFRQKREAEKAEKEKRKTEKGINYQGYQIIKNLDSTYEIFELGMKLKGSETYESIQSAKNYIDRISG